MKRDTDEDWRHLARDKPYWSVLSVDKYASQHLTPEDREDFFKSGDVFVEALIGAIQRHLSPGFKPERVLDFGCGVGRLTIPLGRRATQAVGVDVAPAMLELCVENAHKAGIDNLVVIQSDDALSQVTGRFNLVNSYIVLQHVEPSRGVALIERLLGLLEPGGIASLHLTYGKDRRFWPHQAPLARYFRRDGAMIKDLSATEDVRPVGTISMFDYDLNEVFAMASSHADGPMVVLPTNDDGHLGVQLLLKIAP